MICLLLIMTMIFMSSSESSEQRVRHSDTLLQEEDMNAKTKAWLLMVESGKVDEEELRRITPKSIFIAPLLTSRAGKCKEGYRHDHLGQCVKVIKIDPQVQLELLLQKLNKLYGDKKEEKEEATELLEVSSGPLHFSLPISNAEGKSETATGAAKLEIQVSSTTINTTAPEIQKPSEFVSIPLPILYNQTNEINQTKEIESSGAEPFNETEAYETSQFEGSGTGQSESGDGFQEEELTTPSQVSLFSEETDYFDVTETETTAFTEVYSTMEPSVENIVTPKATVKVLLRESYQNSTSIPSLNHNTTVLYKEFINKEIIAKNKSNSEKIHFPSDDDNEDLKTSFFVTPSAQSSRIRFPDESPQQELPSYHLPSDSSSKSLVNPKYKIHPSAIPRKQFWWLPKNWQIDETQHKSALVKVWSRLPLIHDITFSNREAADGYQKPHGEPHPQIFNPHHRNEEFLISPSQQPTSKIEKPFKSSRFQDFPISPRQNFKLLR